MQGGVNYNGSTLLSGGINVNTTGNIQALNVQVTENGERTITPPEGVDGYAPITIDTNVPIPEPLLDTLNVTSNGTYTPPSGVDGYDEVVVHVPETPLSSLAVTANGTYTAPTGTGYNEVSVNVPAPENALVIKNYEGVPTSIASFSDGTSNPLKSLTASIVPVQAGSGDPSPTNVRPISGWTEEVVTRTGKNFLPSPKDGTYSGNGIEATVNDGVITITGTTNASGNAITIPLDHPIELKSGMYLHYINNVVNTSLAPSFELSTDVSGTSLSYNFSSINRIVEIPSSLIGKKWDRIRFYIANNVNCNCVFSPMLMMSNSASQYEPYAGTTTTIPFVDGQGQSVEVFGGSVDVVNGVVTPCPYYASYNGEQLTGEWLSDRDVYSPNTSPTIGAQVVNIGSTDTSFSTQPTSIKSLDGENNVFASTGDVKELKYFANL